MEEVHQDVSNDCFKIATPSLATSSSSGYKSGGMVPEGGKSPLLRKYVPSKDLGTSKTTSESTIL